MTNLFPDIKKARELLRKKESELPNEIKAELLERLPGRISRNIERGCYYICHSLGSFSIFNTKYYVEAVKEVQNLLKAEGYHVESYVKDYNGYYNNIIMLISWDIDRILNDKFLLSQYDSEKTNKILQEIK